MIIDFIISGISNKMNNNNQLQSIKEKYEIIQNVFQQIKNIDIGNFIENIILSMPGPSSSTPPASPPPLISSSSPPPSIPPQLIPLASPPPAISRSSTAVTPSTPILMSQENRRIYYCYILFNIFL